MLVISNEEPLTNSNRLAKPSDRYQVSDDTIDFESNETFDDMIGMLDELLNDDLHIVGSRNFVYHSQCMRDVVIQMKEKCIEGFSSTMIPFNHLPRTGNLRDTAIRLYEEYNE